MKEFADDNFKLDEDGRKFSFGVENTVGKRRNCSLRAMSPFSHSVFKRLVLKTCKNQGLFGKGLKLLSAKSLSLEESKICHLGKG